MLDNLGAKILLAIEVIIKRAFGNIYRIQNFLESSTVVALAHEHAYTLIQEAVPARFFFCRSRHVLIIRPVVFFRQLFFIMLMLKRSNEPDSVMQKKEASFLIH